MRQGLTSRLAKLVMVSVFCVIGTPLMASETVEFGSDESARYLTELKKLKQVFRECEAAGICKTTPKKETQFLKSLKRILFFFKILFIHS